MHVSMRPYGTAFGLQPGPREVEEMGEDESSEDIFTTSVGPLMVDWPRTVGYYGAVATAVALDLIAPPLGVFIAAVPLLKLLKRESATLTERFIAGILEGAGKPVGGDAEGVVRPKWVDEKKARKGDTRAIDRTSGSVLEGAGGSVGDGVTRSE
jgi:hypothetical protein